MDNNNQQNINTQEQSPVVNSISPTPKKLSNKMIAIGALVLAVVAIIYIIPKYWDVAGGGATIQTAPDSIKAGEVALVRLEVSVPGSKQDINDRYTDIFLYYQITGQDILGQLTPKLISQTKDKEIYEFTIPQYPTAQGEISYYFELKLDGHTNRIEGYKKIKILPDEVQNNQPLTVASSIIIPPLFTGAKWREMSFDPSKIMDFQMAYDDFKYVQEPAKRKQKFIQLPGHLWIATIKNLSDSQLNDTREKFQKYYDDSLKVSSWDWQQDLDSKHISFSGPSADGALGSIWGYVKIQNEKLRLIGLGYQITDYTDVSNGGPIEIKCPCTLELKVFESDEASVNNFNL